MFNGVVVSIAPISSPAAQRVQGFPKFAKFAVVFGFAKISVIGIKKIDVDCDLLFVAAILMPDRAILATHSEGRHALKAEHFHVTQQKGKEGTE